MFSFSWIQVLPFPDARCSLSMMAGASSLWRGDPSPLHGGGPLPHCREETRWSQKGSPGSKSPPFLPGGLMFSFSWIQVLLLPGARCSLSMRTSASFPWRGDPSPLHGGGTLPVCRDETRWSCKGPLVQKVPFFCRVVSCSPFHGYRCLLFMMPGALFPWGQGSTLMAAPLPSLRCQSKILSNM